MQITDRDGEILDTLTRRVRVLSVAQVAATWWPRTKQDTVQAKARLRQLEADGLVKLVPLLTRPVPDLPSPIVAWMPGDQEPDFQSVSYRLRSRWTRPVRQVIAAVATEHAGNRFAGTGGRVPRASESTHDLCLAAVYLRLRAEEPKRAKRWISEAMLFERGHGRDDRLPDAAIVTRAGTTAIEFGGAYAPVKVGDFHRFCFEQGWGYELW